MANTRSVNAPMLASVMSFIATQRVPRPRPAPCERSGARRRRSAPGGKSWRPTRVPGGREPPAHWPLTLCVGEKLVCRSCFGPGAGDTGYPGLRAGRAGVVFAARDDQRFVLALPGLFDRDVQSVRAAPSAAGTSMPGRRRVSSRRCGGPVRRGDDQWSWKTGPARRVRRR